MHRHSSNPSLTHAISQTTAAVVQRRRMPRRQIVTGISLEQRRADRRRKHVGPDGLRRIVLADDWGPLYSG